MSQCAFGLFRPGAVLVTVCLALPFGIAAADDDAAKVSIKIRPVVLFAGGQVKTTVRTPRDPGNRALRVVVEGPDFFASSDVQLDGIDAATSHQFLWKDLPGGPYRVDAILLREGGDKTTVTECFAVLGGSDDGDTAGGQAFPTRRRQQRLPPKPDTMGMKSGC
jgi:hypothetical protein